MQLRFPCHVAEMFTCATFMLACVFHGKYKTGNYKTGNYTEILTLNDRGHVYESVK